MAPKLTSFGVKAYVNYRNTRWFLGRAKDQSDRKLRRQLLNGFREGRTERT